MRIAIANRVSTFIGGAEEYLARIVPALLDRGHEISFFFEHRGLGSAFFKDSATAWFSDEIGAESAIAGLREWSPDVVYCNGLNAPALERALVDIAPSVYSVHAYFGTCISGRKMHSLPLQRPCARRFGAACLVEYFPRRCGGLNPVTMLSSYAREATRLSSIREYSVVVAHSRHMREEYRRHDIETIQVGLPVVDVKRRMPLAVAANGANRLAFVGRMIDVKGGPILFDALAIAAETIPKLELVLAGDGPDLKKWQCDALATERRAPVKISFCGHLSRDERNALLESSNALVVPSVWPEPFAMVGLEAAGLGVPSIAFDVGGIGEWLEDDISGCIASGSPPSAAGLATAIVRCLDAARYGKLATGARQVFERFAAQDVAGKLEEVFRVASSR